MRETPVKHLVLDNNLIFIVSKNPNDKDNPQETKDLLV